MKKQLINSVKLQDEFDLILYDSSLLYIRIQFTHLLLKCVVLNDKADFRETFSIARIA